MPPRGVSQASLCLQACACAPVNKTDHQCSVGRPRSSATHVDTVSSTRPHELRVISVVLDAKLAHAQWPPSRSRVPTNAPIARSAMAHVRSRSHITARPCKLQVHVELSSTCTCSGLETVDDSVFDVLFQKKRPKLKLSAKEDSCSSAQKHQPRNYTNVDMAQMNDALQDANWFQVYSASNTENALSAAASVTTFSSPYWTNMLLY